MRLVANGYHQSRGINYINTFSPVVKPTTIRIIITIALTKISHSDNLMLTMSFFMVIFMNQPLVFIDTHYTQYICHLHNGTYGLKQAPSTWLHRQTSKLLDLPL